MHLLCVGISHRTAPVQLRERVALTDESAGQLLSRIVARHPRCEAAVLSTCNRTELYIARPLHGHPRVDEAIDMLTERPGVDGQAVRDAAYHHDGPDAMRHLFRVTCGLDSMVLGENQIVTQVKRAYELARDVGSVDRVMHRMFQSALSVSKSVRSETKIAEGRVSIGSVAVTFARHLFQRFDDKTLLMIGAGKMGELTLRHFLAERPGRLVVCNRTAARAAEVAERFDGEPATIDDLPTHLADADVVICSTGADRPLVTSELFGPVARRRRHRPLFVIDIAVPRDFDPAVGEFEDVFLYNLDDLQRAVADGHESRRDEIDACDRLIDEAVQGCYNQIQSIDFADLIRQLREQLHEIGEAEAQRTLGRLDGADGSERADIIDDHTRRLVNKILHRPLSELGKADAAQAAMFATALRRLFDLDLSEDLHPPESPRDRPSMRNADRAEQPADGIDK